jgi:hypothetical protein
MSTTWDPLTETWVEDTAVQAQAATDAAAAAAENQRLVDLRGTVDDTGTYHALYLNGSENQASQAVSDISRSKYDDWKDRFFPKVDELMNMTTYMNPNLVKDETTNAANLTGKTFDNVAAVQERNVARFGMNQTVEQQAANDSALSLGRTAATVGAVNDARITLKDRDRSIATGGLTTTTA